MYRLYFDNFIATFGWFLFLMCIFTIVTSIFFVATGTVILILHRAPMVEIKRLLLMVIFIEKGKLLLFLRLRTAFPFF
jgi:hypothetical protein